MSWQFWVGFNVVVLLLIIADMALWARGNKPLSFRQAVIASAVWVGLAGGFAVFVHQWMGPAKALEFITGYIIEESLSVDNLFVFIVLFAYFRVPREQERTVLFWGILGALVMRGIFIVAGVSLVQRFHVILYFFGAFLIYAGVKLFRKPDEATADPSRNPVLRLARRFLPVTDDYEGGRFFVRRNGRLMATPLLLVLLVVETTDVLFATDSIPAILAISRDTFIVYTSNVFAILGLRSLYFALSGLMKLFSYLNYGLAVILIFVGLKMLASDWFPLPTWAALVVIAAVLTVAISASLLFPPKGGENAAPQS